MSDTHGAPPPADGGKPGPAAGNDYGLDADEAAAFAAMRSDPAPQGDPGFVPEAPPADAPPPAAPAAPAAGAAPAPAVAAPGAPAAPAANLDDDDDDEPAPVGADGVLPHQKRVGITKYNRVVQEAKEAKEEAQKLRETQARLDERIRLINEALTPAQQIEQKPVDDDPEPDPNVDIFGHNAWLKRQLVNTQQMVKEHFEGQAQERQAQDVDSHISQTYLTDAERFASKEPNFAPAYQHLMAMRIVQMAHYYFEKDLTDGKTQLTPQEFMKIKSEVGREEKTLVSQAIAKGKSPAAAIFAMAKMSGYRPAQPGAGAAPTNGAATPQPGANGAAAVAAAVAAAPAVNGGAPANGANGAKPTVRAEIDRIKAAQDASVSLSDGGGAPAPTLNAAKLADMAEDDFAAMIEDIGRGGLRKIMGG